MDDYLVVPTFNTYIKIDNLTGYTLFIYLMGGHLFDFQNFSGPLSKGYSLPSSFGATVFYSHESVCSRFLLRRPGTLFLDECKGDMMPL